MVRRVGKPLRLQRQSRGLAVDDPAMTGESAAEFVSGVNLNAGLIGMDLQHPAAEPVKDFDRRAITAKDKAMIVAQTVEYLRVRLQNPSA